MSVESETILSYGIKVHYSEIIFFLKKKLSEKGSEFDEDMWFDALESLFDEYNKHLYFFRNNEAILMKKL